MKLRAIKNHIVFQFIDEVDAKGQFLQTTKWGLYIAGSIDNSAKSPRWGTVTEVGADVKEVKVGQQVLLPALMWTAAFKMDGERYWRSDETKVVAIRDNENSKVVPLRDVVIFESVESESSNDVNKLFVVGETGDSPKGKVVRLGPECSSELKGAYIYYDGSSFFNKFDHKGVKLAFINEPDVLLYEEVA